MAIFKFDLGQIVVLDPTGERRYGHRGKIIGRTEFLDGSVGYIVSCADIQGPIVRHHLNECEIQLADQSS